VDTTPNGSDLARLLSAGIEGIVRDMMRISPSPSLLTFLAKTAIWQKRAAELRSAAAASAGIHIPPFMIASITSRCNLGCAGCYARAQARPPKPEMSADNWRKVFSEARDLGISIILLAGGEPLVRKEVLETAAKYPEILFPVFTNGLLVDEEMVSWFAEHRNIIPVLSIEGYRAMTDGRRGAGVYDRLLTAAGVLKKRGVFFGASITVTRENIEVVTSDHFVGNLNSGGCRAFFYVEYVPVKEGTDGWILSKAQSQSISLKMDELRGKYAAVFIGFPGDEGKLGGCLAAGRGFVHISPSGDLEPCPFAPYSDTSVANLPLRDALQSRFLERIRDNHGVLDDGKGGCALWEKRELVKTLLSSVETCAEGEC
jgi:MoaA/NifB/PqqE/SkfB family radical SAM enzyme